MTCVVWKKLLQWANSLIEKCCKNVSLQHILLQIRKAERFHFYLTACSGCQQQNLVVLKKLNMLQLQLKHLKETL